MNYMERIKRVGLFRTDENVSQSEIGATQLASHNIKSHGMLWTYGAQLQIMLKRNTITQIRFWKSTLVQAIGAPLIFMFLLFFLQHADYANQKHSNKYPESTPLQGLYSCSGPVPCISIMFTPPDDETVKSFMTTFAAKNANRTGEPEFTIADPISSTSTSPTKNLGLVPVPSKQFIYDYVVANPNVTNWAINFNRSIDVSGHPNVAYQVWYNLSYTANGIDVFGNQIQSLMRGMDEAIITVLNDPSATVKADLNIKTKAWPTVAPATLSDTVVQQLGPVFFFCCVMVIFINALSQILMEKEIYLRNGMEVMGLKPSIYWISEFCSNTVLILIGSISTICLGLAFGFTSFRNTNFLTLFLTFMLFGQSMVTFAFFLSTFFRKAQSGVFVGIFVFMVGLIFESFVFSSGYIGYLWWKPTSPIGLTYILQVLPFFNFGVLFLQITTLTTGELDIITNQYTPGDGFPWTAMYKPIPANLLPTYPDGTQPIVPTPMYFIYNFLGNMLLYSVLTWYFDNVIPNEFGVSQPLWFPFSKTYWGFEEQASEKSRSDWLQEIKKEMGTVVATPLQRTSAFGNLSSQSPSMHAIDEDVIHQRELALSDKSWPPIKIVHLRKEYTNWKKTVTKTAVHDTCVAFENSKVFALLGQNGAGKSTTLNILSGLSPATNGDALIFGYSLKTQIHQIRQLMGVCPQHDILFNELTAREHIELYSGLKGVPSSEWTAIVEERLGAVKLLNVVDNPVASYSGGMKRRLSVVIATIGDPKVVFLDEPTTGMDPVNRRYVWTFIEKFKKDRVIILTTHSMEEADVLGDRIAIMAHGRIRAYGDATTLKTKFGTGYKLSIISDPSKLARTKLNVAKWIPGSQLEDDSAGALLYQFPNTSLQYVSKVIKTLSAEENIKGWGISQTTLEQVFLSVIRGAEKEEREMVMGSP